VGDHTRWGVSGGFEGPLSGRPLKGAITGVLGGQYSCAVLEVIDRVTQQN
jgi:hypothetical protein